MKHDQKGFHRIHRSAGLALAAAVALSLFSGFCVVPEHGESCSELGNARISTVQHLNAAAKTDPAAKQKDDKGPSKDDLAGCSSKLEYPSNGAWLDKYQTRYVESSGGKGIYLCYKPGEESFSILEDGTEVTVLARTERNSLVISEDGEIGWCLSSMLWRDGGPDMYEYFRGEDPSKADLAGCSSKLQKPKKTEYLECYSFRYVDSRNGIYLCYEPGEKSFSTLRDCTEVAVLAQHEKNVLVITGYGEIGWCLASKLSYEPPYAAEGPSRMDLFGASSKLQYPSDDAWLDEYETRYVESSSGNGIYLCYKPGEGKFATLEDGTKVTVLARTEKNSLVVTEDEEIGWCLSRLLVK